MNDLSKVSIKRIEGLEATIADIYAKIEDASKKGTAHSVGEVFWSQSNLAEENLGALPLFTGDHVAASTYSALHAFILRHNELVKTKQEYDALVADTTKDCPFYAIDNGQIYLPILRNFIKAANTTDGIEQVNAGLPNITGTATGFEGRTSATGAFSMDPVGNTGAAEHWVQRSGDNVLTLDASKSSDVYGGSNTVTPAHSTLYPWVSYVATVHDIVTPIEYAKADLSNVTGIDQQSAVNAALEGKQDVLPEGTTGYYLQKTSTGVQWANVQGGGGGGVSITVQNYENNTGDTLATGLTLTDFSTILVYKNGVLLTSGANNDYTISTNDIVFTEPLLATDRVTLICFGSAS